MASSKQAIWMTFAAAAGTLVVVVGVLAGPAILRCSADPDGLLACLRGQVVDAGLMPGEEPAPVPAVPTPVPPVNDVTPAEPDLDLIRAEPDGHVVIAGSAEPGIEVEVFANGDLVGKVMAEASGDWVLVPDRPLAVGTAEITVGIAGSNARSPHSFTVVIPEDKVSAPVITASESSADPVEAPAVTAEPAPPPAADSQPPTAEAVPPPAPQPAAPAIETPAVAEAPPAEPEPVPVPLVEQAVVPEPEPAPSTEPAPPAAQAGQPELTPSDEPQPNQPVEVPSAAPPQAEQPAAPDPAPQPVEPLVDPPAIAEAPPSEPEPVPPVEQAAGPQPVAPISADPAAPSEQVALPDVTLPDKPGPAPDQVTPVPSTPATIDAIEIDGSANYFAGAGPDGATVRLYVQDRFIASATVEGGRWLVEARSALTLPVQRVRVDLVQQQGAVSARAEVNFVIDVPPPAPEIEVAGTGTGAVAPASSAAGELAIPLQVESELEVDPTIPTLRALPSVAPEMLRFASGKAIIRRGETLWAIARRVYGDGSLYHRIVEANRKLIRSPGRIYPGQVFDLPKFPDAAAVD